MPSLTIYSGEFFSLTQEDVEQLEQQLPSILGYEIVREAKRFSSFLKAQRDLGTTFPDWMIMPLFTAYLAHEQMNRDRLGEILRQIAMRN